MICLKRITKGTTADLLNLPYEITANIITKHIILSLSFNFKIINSYKFIQQFHVPLFVIIKCCFNKNKTNIINITSHLYSKAVYIPFLCKCKCIHTHSTTSVTQLIDNIIN